MSQPPPSGPLPSHRQEEHSRGENNPWEDAACRQLRRGTHAWFVHHGMTVKFSNVLSNICQQVAKGSKASIVDRLCPLTSFPDLVSACSNAESFTDLLDGGGYGTDPVFNRSVF